MAGEMEQLFVVAGRVYVIFRRKTNRTINVEWAIANADYVRVVIKRARETQVNELIQLADRIEDTHPLLPRIKKTEVASTKAGLDVSKYVHSLR